MGNDQVSAESPLEAPTRALETSDPAKIARNAAVDWQDTGTGEGIWSVRVLNGTVEVGYPVVTVRAPRELDTFPIKLLTLLYLVNSDGTKPSGAWIPFRDLPGGRFYEPVVQRSVEEPLAEAFGENAEGFGSAALSLGGKRLDFGEASYSFSLFPGVLICFVLWTGDDEFPARAQVLFDSNCPRHLCAFDLRMGAQEISGKMVKARQA